MHTRERILTIRLLEKVSAKPAYGKTLGIVVGNGTAERPAARKPVGGKA
jgi:hypothetical protein